jgi:hypothetical protein
LRAKLERYGIQEIPPAGFIAPAPHGNRTH